MSSSKAKKLKPPSKPAPRGKTRKTKTPTQAGKRKPLAITTPKPTLSPKGSELTAPPPSSSSFNFPPFLSCSVAARDVPAGSGSLPSLRYCHQSVHKATSSLLPPPSSLPLLPLPFSLLPPPSSLPLLTQDLKTPLFPHVPLGIEREKYPHSSHLHSQHTRHHNMLGTVQYHCYLL